MPGRHNIIGVFEFALHAERQHFATPPADVRCQLRLLLMMLSRMPFQDDCFGSLSAVCRHAVCWLAWLLMLPPTRAAY